MACFNYPAQYSLNAHEQVGGTCYAHAIATVIRAAECRIVGRQPLAHRTLVDQIIQVNGTDGANCEVVLQQQCPERQLRFKNLGSTSAEEECATVLQSIRETLQHRTLLLSFCLDDDQWSNFSAFFNRHPTGILRGEDIGECRGPPTGHAVVVTGEGEKAGDAQVTRYWKCKNSWGAKFGDSGRFRIDQHVFPMRWIDVFFQKHELTPSDFQRFRVAPVKASIVVKSSVHALAAQLQGALQTGLEDGQRLDVDFASLKAGRLCLCEAHPHGRASLKDMYILQDDKGECFALKLFRDTSDASLLQEEMVKQLIAAAYASTFDVSQHRIKFCVPVIVEVVAACCANGDRAGSWIGRYALVEPLLSGLYSKFLFEPTEAPHDLSQAFFHHSYESSDRQMVVWDLQGVATNDGYCLTDPCIVFGVPGAKTSLMVPTLQAEATLVGMHSMYGDHHSTFKALHSCNNLCATLRAASNVHILQSVLVHGDVAIFGDLNGYDPEPFEQYINDGLEVYHSEPDYDDGPDVYSEPDYDDGARDVFSGTEFGNYDDYY